MTSPLDFLAPTARTAGTKISVAAAKRAPSSVSVMAVRNALLSTSNQNAVCPLPPITTNLIASVIAAVYAANKEESSPLSPFRKTAQALQTSPRDVIEYLKSSGHKVMRGHGSTEMINPSYSVISSVSNIAKGTLASIDSGRMGFNADTLESWRQSLVIIGKTNDDPTLSCFEDKLLWLTELVDDISGLDSTLKIEVVEEWAVRYSGLMSTTIDAEVSRSTPDYASYYLSIINVWRTEVESGKVADLTLHTSLLSVLKTVTSSTRLKRGFHRLIGAVHASTPRFNSAITYSATNYSEYRNRYSRDDQETGFTADIALAYCFFLGINPVALLSWIVAHEQIKPGDYTFKANAVEADDLIHWHGVMSPVEYIKFVDLVCQMQIIKDKDMWTMARFHYSYVFSSLPTIDSLERYAATNLVTLRPLVDEVGVSIYSARVVSHPRLCEQLMQHNLLVNINHLDSPAKAHLKHAICLGFEAAQLWSDQAGYENVIAKLEAVETKEEKEEIFNKYLRIVTNGLRFPMCITEDSYEDGQVDGVKLAAELMFYGLGKNAGLVVDIEAQE